METALLVALLVVTLQGENSSDVTDKCTW